MLLLPSAKKLTNKDTSCVIPLTRGPQSHQYHGHRSQKTGCQGLGVGGELVFHAVRTLVWEDGRVLEVECCDVHTAI